MEETNPRYLRTVRDAAELARMWRRVAEVKNAVEALKAMNKKGRA